MRLLFYGPNYAPEKTGTGKYTAEMAQWFASRGHDVAAIVGPPHYPEWQLHPGFKNRHTEATEGGVNVRRVPMYIPSGEVTSKKRIRMEASFSFHAARPWLRRLFSRSKPDAIIAVCPPMQVGFWPWFYGAIRRVPWVYHVQDLQVDAAVRLAMVKGGLFAKVLYAIEQFFLKRATRVSTITEGMANRIHEKGVPRDRIMLVPNWSDLNFMAPGSRQNEFRDELNLRPDDLLLLYSGNMGKKQGLETILDAARLLANDSRFQFLLVGDGATRASLKEAAADLANVRFLGLQPWARVPDMLNAADIHLVVQKQEAADLVMPSKLTNILAVGGCAIGTTSEGTLYDVLAQVGVTAAPDDSEALAEVIQTLDEASARAERQARARQWAEEHLDQDRILAALEEQLASL